jgi:hypothetical protein
VTAWRTRGWQGSGVAHLVAVAGRGEDGLLRSWPRPSPYDARYGRDGWMYAGVHAGTLNVIDWLFYAQHAAHTAADISAAFGVGVPAIEHASARAGVWSGELRAPAPTDDCARDGRCDGTCERGPIAAPQACEDCGDPDAGWNRWETASGYTYLCRSCQLDVIQDNTAPPITAADLRARIARERG